MGFKYKLNKKWKRITTLRTTVITKIAKTRPTMSFRNTKTFINSTTITIIIATTIATAKTTTI